MPSPTLGSTRTNGRSVRERPALTNNRKSHIYRKEKIEIWQQVQLSGSTLKRDLDSLQLMVADKMFSFTTQQFKEMDTNLWMRAKK